MPVFAGTGREETWMCADRLSAKLSSKVLCLYNAFDQEPLDPHGELPEAELLPC